MRDDYFMLRVRDVTFMKLLRFLLILKLQNMKLENFKLEIFFF